MDINLNCPCGGNVSADDVSPATAELVIDRFWAVHPHDDARALAAATTPFRMVDTGDEDES